MDISIRELAALIAERTGFSGQIRWDATRPDGMLRKCLDVSQLRAMGFEPAIGLEPGIAQTLDEYRALRARERVGA